MRIYLFGSFAEGKQNADSDFDFYIIVDDSQKDMLGLTAKAYKAIRHKQKRSVDIIVNTEKTFKDRKERIASVESEVVQKGVLLYGAQGGMPKKHNLSFLLEQIKNKVEIPEKYYDYADA